jgi:ubiquinone/menaquinone biosynthesis C-methylase UbiE
MAGGHREYWSQVARDYDRVVDLQIGPRSREMVRQRLSREGRLGAVAELGCGSGFYTAVLAEKADSVIATDIAPGMLELARDRVAAPNVHFQAEDCQQTALADAAFDTVFMSLLLHFTDSARTIAEIRRILRPGGRVIISNLDPRALGGLARLRCLARIACQGFRGYRAKPPPGGLMGVMTERELCDLLERSGFTVDGAETITDASRSSHIPLEYITATKR